jgi:hypothetical protein
MAKKATETKAETAPQETPAHTGRPVIVTTAHRGVMFGYAAEGANLDGEVVEITHARFVVRWAGVRGLPGLAHTGPNDQCRISPPAPGWRIRNITSVLLVSPEAARAFEAAPWAR